MDNIRVYLVDDYDLARERLRAVLEMEADIEVVGEAPNGEQAVRELESCEADVVFMDIEMPGMNGIDTTRELKQKCPDLTILVLTSHENEYVSEAMEAGAIGYLLKLASAKDIIQVLRNAYLHSRSRT